MKTHLASGLMAVLLGIAGCNQSPPAVVETRSVPVEETYELTVPRALTTVKQGTSKAAAIGIRRGKKFDQDVTLEFTGLPRGLTCAPPNLVIPRRQAEGRFTLTAENDAAVGDFTVKVTGHTATVPDVATDLPTNVYRVHK